MWSELDKDKRDEYKKLMLAFASLSEVFAQKSDETKVAEKKLVPIVNSKYQEKTFQHVFGACQEDIGNSPYDASLVIPDSEGRLLKYLIGIKTFGFASDFQKVAQFKKDNNRWTKFCGEIVKNVDGLEEKSQENINRVNAMIYQEMAKTVSKLRNEKMSSARARISGFSVDEKKDEIDVVYHVLMPVNNGDAPNIIVGETSYDEIDIENIIVEGCTQKNNPTNIIFNDGKHRYKFTPTDCQLYMDFSNQSIQIETWGVTYLNDPYEFFSDLGKRLFIDEYASEDEIIERYEWPILNENGMVDLSSGFNSFYATGSKMGASARKSRIKTFENKYKDVLSEEALNFIIKEISYLLDIKSIKKGIIVRSKKSLRSMRQRFLRRDKLMEFVSGLDKAELFDEVQNIVYRTYGEVYIPIPNSTIFHREHPDFFKSTLNGSDNSFMLVLEPSGKKIRAHITQTGGKAIESSEHQDILGKWLLQDIFQLKAREPLTRERINDMGINGYCLFKKEGSSDVHFKFIWKDGWS